ncbi:hypothetical protein [Microvirga tunisiensis]|uniref:Uncharacterized protein n=1 Tax=Microvirga tunisiensis TaxID=2108360 RepID=A0A5N7MHH8_9HYPH|nr:hypothetical protein [Microvirga tunisiensis]MPR07795.1 hypothetical protein [Microvirga tunisiensis]MPR26190.1 hypothetical protein [Microvirga tunisiensis]
MPSCADQKNNIGFRLAKQAPIPTSKPDPAHRSVPPLPISVAGHKLRDVTNDTRWHAYCGPTAVAAITGESLSRIRDVFRTVRYGSDWTTLERAPAVKGTSTHNVQQVLRIFGYESRWHTIEGNPTLRAWLERCTGAMRTHPGVVMVTGHWIAFSGWTVCDTFSEGEVIDAEDARCRRSRVKGALLISGRVPPRVEVLDLQAAQLAQKTKVSNHRVAFARLAKRLNASVSRDDMYLWVEMPSGICLAMRHWDWTESYSNLSSFAENPDLSRLERADDGSIYWFPR